MKVSWHFETLISNRKLIKNEDFRDHSISSHEQDKLDIYARSLSQLKICPHIYVENSTSELQILKAKKKMLHSELGGNPKKDKTVRVGTLPISSPSAKPEHKDLRVSFAPTLYKYCLDIFRSFLF